MSEAGLADFAAEWAQGRAARAEKAAKKAATPRTPEQEAAAAASAEARIAQREQRITDGLAELDRWLVDHLREGFAKTSAQRPVIAQRFAARMVDAQAPGMATRLRDLVDITDTTRDWPNLLTEEFGMIHLLIRAWRCRESLPEDLAATVRTHLGITVRTEDVLAREGIVDEWVVMGMRDFDEERVSVRYVWLYGKTTKKWALVLFFAAGGATLSSTLYPGTQLTATVHYYPGRGQYRSVLSGEDAQAVDVTGWMPTAISINAAKQQWRDAVADDPWVEACPVIVAGRLAVDEGGAFALIDDGGAIPLVGLVEDHWRLALTATCDDLVVAGELSTKGLLPISICEEGTVKPL